MTLIDLADLKRWLGADPWPSSVDADSLVLGLLENLASPDPDVRDRLSYSLIGRLVMEGQVSLGGMKTLLGRALDSHHLFAGIGRTEDDSVFRRSFSVLVVTLCLDRDRDTVRQAWSGVLRYAVAEEDFRGYVSGKGWAHAVAHTADALGALLRHPTTGAAAADALLVAVHRLATVPYPLGYLEDDRLAMAVFLGMRAQNVPDPAFKRFLDRFQRTDDGTDGGATLRGANAEHFLRSLYFLLLGVPEMESRIVALREAIDRFDIWRLDPPAEAQ